MTNPARINHMLTDRQNTIRSLTFAIEAIKAHKVWKTWNPRSNRAEGTAYWWASKGWEANGYEGPYIDIIAALRRHVEDGDLTWWWHHRQQRRHMVALFKAALSELKKQERLAA